ncbi:MAG: RlmF-related methyltransferase, partial [Bacteroidia bacterium]
MYREGQALPSQLYAEELPLFHKMPDKPKPSPTAVKLKLHRRNKHKTRYNFKKLIEQTPELGKYVA